MSINAPHVRRKTLSEVRNVAVSFSNRLDDAETLTSITSITEVTSLGMTISNGQVNVAVVIINGISVPIGEAVLFRVSGGTVGRGAIRLIVVTSASPPQTLYSEIELDIVDD